MITQQCNRTFTLSFINCYYHNLITIFRRLVLNMEWLTLIGEWGGISFLERPENLLETEDKGGVRDQRSDEGGRCEWVLYSLDSRSEFEPIGRCVGKKAHSVHLQRENCLFYYFFQQSKFSEHSRLYYVFFLLKLAFISGMGLRQCSPMR